MGATDFTLGVDIGGTHVRIGVVAPDGRVVSRVDSRLPPDGEPALLHALLADGVRQATGECGTPTGRVGVALPGVWNRASGVLERALNLPRLEGVELRRFFAEAVGGPVFLESDVNAAGWAQWHHLDPRPARFVYLSLGTGVGGSVILDGELVRHTRGVTGHFGFLVVDTSTDAPVDAAGVPGCLSAVAAGPALQGSAPPGEPLKYEMEPVLSEAVRERAARGLAVALANVVYIYAPDCIVLGGGVIDHHPELVEDARAVLDRYRGDLVPAELAIEQAALRSDDAGVIGAALLARRSA